MGQYSINDFQIGDSVYHLSNKELIMIVEKIKNNPDKISCSWVDKSGVRHSEKFQPQVFGKANDLVSGIYVG